VIIIAGHLTMAETDRGRFIDAYRDLVESGPGRLTAASTSR
jgi:hypothetical protein